MNVGGRWKTAELRRRTLKVKDLIHMLESAGEKGGLMTYTVIFEKGPASWGAYVPDLPGVIAVGDSRDEVQQLIQEAIEFHLEGMREQAFPYRCLPALPGRSKSITPRDQAESDFSD